MSKPPEKTPPPPRSDQPTAVGSQGSDKRSGRVAYDSRGNPTWEWQLETGVYSRDMSTQRLKKLDLGDLSIAETARHKKPAGFEGADESTAPTKPGGGFNPYDNTPAKGSGGGFNPYDSARAAGSRMRPASGKSTTPPPRTPADLKKLEEWMKLKKRVAENKEDDDE